VLYIFCRYSALFYLGAICFVFQFLVDCPLEVSKAFDNLQFWAAIVVYVPFQILVGVRTYALYHGSRLIKWGIIALFVVYMLVAIGVGVLFSEKGVYGQIPLRGASCVIQLQKYPTASIITLFLSGAAYDLVLWILLVVRVYQLFVKGHTRLIGVIFKLGLVYFAFVTVMYIVCAVMYITFPPSKLLIPTAVSHSLQAMGSVLSARFILHLRSFLNDLTIQSMSVSPERVMRAEDELRFGGMTAPDEESDTPGLTSG